MLLLAALVVASCTSEAEKAEQDYQFLVDAKASKSDLCAAAKKAEQASVSEHNSEKYLHWQITSMHDCFLAQEGQ